MNTTVLPTVSKCNQKIQYFHQKSIVSCTIKLTSCVPARMYLHKHHIHKKIYTFQRLNKVNTKSFTLRKPFISKIKPTTKNRKLLYLSELAGRLVFGLCSVTYLKHLYIRYTKPTLKTVKASKSFVTKCPSA